MAKTVIFGEGSTENELWSHLSESGKPIIIYGMGNGADKIIAVLEERGMRAADFFASDGFVRGQLFHGKRVLSLSEVKEKYTDFIILVAFGSHLPEVCGAIRRLDEQYELYAPDVPVAGEELFDADYYEANKVRFESARALLADEHSRFVFDCVIKYKLSGKISCLAACESGQENDMRAIFPDDFTAYCDLGAYNGDTLKSTLSLYRGIKKAVAFEPSAKVCAKLAAYAQTLDMETRVCNLAAWDKREELSFADGAARNSIVTAVNDKALSGAKMRAVTGDTLDANCDFAGEKLYIKYDVEGAEERALAGSRRIIGENEVSLLISAYHRSSDLFRLVEIAHEMLPQHKIYLRKHPYIPAWDINLYVSERGE